MLGIALGFKRSTVKVTVTINRSICYVFSVMSFPCNKFCFVLTYGTQTSYIGCLWKGDAWDCFWVQKVKGHSYYKYICLFRFLRYVVSVQ
jgi:hypothetical protein